MLDKDRLVVMILVAGLAINTMILFTPGITGYTVYDNNRMEQVNISPLILVALGLGLLYMLFLINYKRMIASHKKKA